MYVPEGSSYCRTSHAMLKRQVPTWFRCPSPTIGCIPSCFGSGSVRVRVRVRVRCGDRNTLRCVYSTVLYCTARHGTLDYQSGSRGSNGASGSISIPASDEPIPVQDPGLGGQVHGTRLCSALPPQLLQCTYLRAAVTAELPMQCSKDKFRRGLDVRRH